MCVKTSIIYIHFLTKNAYAIPTKYFCLFVKCIIPKKFETYLFCLFMKKITFLRFDVNVKRCFLCWKKPKIRRQLHSSIKLEKIINFKHFKFYCQHLSFNIYLFINLKYFLNNELILSFTVNIIIRFGGRKRSCIIIINKKHKTCKTSVSVCTLYLYK